MSDANDWMTSRLDRRAQFPLDVQSRGRPLTGEEQALADALEAIFSEGVHDMDAVAEALTAKGLVAPGSGGTDWTRDSLLTELQSINRSLDDAHNENGYGA
ncbi:recombinase-like helix-turn-helix domain-containing protein [Moorena bouillonii]|uniref:Recombinase-like domain-containing protein n=1 Tax=Moorena bouillonii PNG TaxID=568701 RepID=A0A1U7N2R0_9CYAN|nr:recombinase-like helix-turn-helix domain-containing protein [Moorena bouillonii]OLT60216.1 hypothetical protein BJP37_15485 [Moorena bouillonii PNG]